MPNTDIQRLISNFAAELEKLARQAAVEQVIADLGGARASAPRRGRPPGSKNKVAATAGAGIKPVQKGRRRSAEDVAAMGSTLVDYVKSNPGQRADQIAAALRTDPHTIRLPMQALLAARKVKTQGQRRGTKYFVAGAAVPSAARAKRKTRTKKKK